jgi:hypothetical protein
MEVEITSKKDLYNNTIDKQSIKKECFYIKIFIVIAYFAICISIEQIYRESLFDKSIEIQEDIRNDHDKESAFYDFWKFMTNF